MSSSPIKVPASGPASASVMVIGEAPGQWEERLGGPFLGPSGTLLREALASSGIDPAGVFFSNLCKYRPPNNELRAWFTDEGLPNNTVYEGLAELKEEISLVNPRLIIPVGNYPLKILTGRGRWTKEGYTGIGDYRGYLLEGSAFCGGRPCLPTYHPAAAIRQYSLKHIIRTDLNKAARLLREGTFQSPRKYVLVDPIGAAREDWTGWLASPPGTLSPPIYEYLSPLGEAYSDGDGIRLASDSFGSADVEYLGSKLLCVGFTRHRDCAVVFSTGSLAEVDRVRNLVECGVDWCWQNGMFDCSILDWHYGIKAFLSFKHDTMVAMHNAYVELPKDLGFIGSVFTDLPPWWQHVNGEFWKEVRDAKRSILEVLPYNGGDVLCTHEAMEKLLGDELTDPDVARSYHHEMSLIRPLWEMSRRGVRIDTPSMRGLQDTLQREADAYLYGIAKYNGDRPVNVKSPPQVAAFLYDTMGIPKTGPKTPGGRWKMDDTTLADLQLRVRDERQRTAIKMVRESRERLDLISKFCEIELDDDGRMRCHYDPAKTDTGRLASRKFYPTGRGSNLQNVPRDVRVRAVFVPDSGCIFGYADLKSAESFVVAHVTGDIEMLRLHSPEYLSGKLDGHKYVASFLLEKPIELITKDERYLGKRVRHAGNYGMSWAKLQMIVNADAQKTGVSIDAAQAKRLIAKYRALHPMLQTWWDDVAIQLRTSHTIYTQHRRKRVFFDRADACLPEAIAYNPQGTVADTLNMGLLRVAASEELAALDFELLLQVHDAIGFQVPERNADAALSLLSALLDIPVPITRLKVPRYEIHIPVDIQVGYNWGDWDEKKNPSGLKGWKPSA